MKLGMEVGLGLRQIVLNGDPAPLPQRGTAPNFRSVSIVAKWSPISATAEHLFSDAEDLGKTQTGSSPTAQRRREMHVG